MRTNVVPILESYGVDLVLSGHSHDYERSCLLHGHYGHSTTLTPAMIQDAGSGRPSETGAYMKTTTGPSAGRGTVYAVAGSSGWATYQYGRHPAMYVSELQTGSMIIDIDGDRLDAIFLRETGAIDDSFTIVKDAPPEPLRFATFTIVNGKMVARWKSLATHSYRVEWTPNLGGQEWTSLGEVISATGATASVTNGLPAGAAEGYFRVAEVTN